MMRRKIVQWLTLITTNAYIPGFIKGNIYKGPLKQFCVPGLNCYSCPGALGACPIGSLQAVIGSFQYQMSFYAVGLLMAFGILLGRLICGFLCPFGLIQELIHKIPVPKIKKPWRWPRYLKYTVLLIVVIGMPLFLQNSFGISAPAFCKYICPAGTLTAGLPLLGANEPLRATLGWLFALKISIAGFIIIGSLFIYRFFCRYFCPLGAIYALFNRISLYQVQLDNEKCMGCGTCKRVCKMGVNPSANPASTECIRCGDCIKTCPQKALSASFITGVKKQHACGDRVFRRTHQADRDAPPLGKA